MRLFAWIFAAAHAPFAMRFVLQPVLALVLGMRDGRWDARDGRPPFGSELVARKGQRARLAREALGRVAVPFTLAVVLDGVVQWLVEGRVRLLDAAGVGALLVACPYVLARGLANRWVVRGRRSLRAVR
ncbi:MAG: hypothetical protein RL653_2059 [Pseudomonadota bacterium]|jgi:hypothetical protein